ncbi:retrovirus-related pol polyprotein from transposon TNT 1-94 [Tanacetum coccineum]
MPELIVAIKTTGNNLKFTLNSPMEEKQIEKQLENLSLKDLFKRVLKALMKKITISYISKNNENEFVLPANCYEKFILNNIHVVAYMDSLDDFAKKYKYTGIYDSSTVYDEVNKYLNSMKKFHNDGIGERVMNQVKANNRKEQKIGGFDSEMEHHNVINIMRLLQDDDMEEIQVANMVGLQTVRELEDEFVKKFCMTILKLQEIVNDYDQNKKKKKKKQQQPIRSLSKKESKHVTWNADHAGCQDTCRSTSGSVQFLGNKLVSWSSKKQKSTAISTIEAKYIVMAGCLLLLSVATTSNTQGPSTLTSVTTSFGSKLQMGLLNCTSCRWITSLRTYSLRLYQESGLNLYSRVLEAARGRGCSGCGFAATRAFGCGFITPDEGAFGSGQRGCDGSGCGTAGVGLVYITMGCIWLVVFSTGSVRLVYLAAVKVGQRHSLGCGHVGQLGFVGRVDPKLGVFRVGL